MGVKSVAAVAVACVVLCGCAEAPANVPLNALAHDHIGSTEVVASVKQSEIYVFVPPSELAQRGGGGLLLALVDAGIDKTRTGRAEEAVGGLRNAVVDYDFDGRLRGELQGALTGIAWLKVNGSRVIKDDQPASLDQAITASKSAAVLLADTDYHLSNDGRILSVTMDVRLYANTPELAAYRQTKGTSTAKSAPVNALYRNSFSENISVVGDGETREVNLPIWSADHGAKLRQALDESAATLARRLASDLSGAASTPSVGATALVSR